MRTVLAAQIAAGIAFVAACGSTIDYVKVSADGGDDGASSSSGSSGDVDGAAGDGGGDASTDPGEAGPVDPGPQSGSIQINASHTSSTDDPSLFGTVARRWSKVFPGFVAFPLIAHGKVIVTYPTADDHAAVEAFDLATGAPVWGPIDLGPEKYASSAYDRGRVFALTRKGTLRAFDVDSGALQWTTELAIPATPMQFLAAPTAYGGKVYILPSNFGQAVAVHEGTGAVAWKSGKYGAYASPAVTDVAAYIALNCETAYRLGLGSGTVIWQSDGGCNGSPNSPVVFGTKLLIGSESGSTNAIDLTSGKYDNTRMGGWLPAAHADMVFMAFNGMLLARTYPTKPTDNVYWSTQDRDDPGFIRAAAMIAGGHVHVLWDNCAFRVFEERTGALVWEDSEAGGCVNLGGLEGAPVSIAAAGGAIVVPFGRHVVTYGVTPIPDGGADAPAD